ncbi:MAG: glycosyltransferase family 1 protein [Candidatus Roizmanbacteria bacterium]|nr:glycosyltransferase family 1 protein [Candidatus Roizmanbacteria bacterium]
MKKTIIGIDGNEANVIHKVGVSVYTHNLLKYFHSQATEDLQFIVYLRNNPSEELPKETEHFKYKVVWGPTLWSQLFLPLHLWIYKFLGNYLDVFFSPAHYIPRFCPFKTIVTIHDLSYLYFPTEFLKKDLFQLKNWTEYALKNSQQIIAVSKTTKKDIIHEYSIPDEKISVIYNGYTNPIHDSDSHKQKLSYPYFLYIGTVQPRKNLNVLITAFAEFYKTHKEFKLIIAGKKGWLYESIFKLVEELGMKQTILFPGFVSEEEKDRLYKKAAAFILPSLYEGFGIPLLEAMAHECPVISSFSSSLPEIGGEACLYFDPKNSDDLVEKMNSIITNKELVKKLSLLGKKRIEIFSWEETGKNTLHILQSIHE